MPRKKLTSPSRTIICTSKKANTALLSKIVIRKVVHISLGIVQIPALSTPIAWLKEYKETLTRIFSVYYTKRNKKWAKYLVHRVPSRILLKDVMPKIAAKVFEQFYNIQSE